MKVSLISTIFNEENSIKNFLDSILLQSKNPDEIVIVDGGSTDRTFAILSRFKLLNYNKRIRIIKKLGNRSVGRNEAIKNATGDVIVCSDSGNILDKEWIKNIVKPFQDKQIDVVAGYYKGLGKSVFQQCVIPYVLVMPDKVNPQSFLPATRSVAFRKSVWKKIGGFPEEFSHNEDYVFAKRLQKNHVSTFFAKDALVYWIPRKTVKEAFIMFFRFALGDSESRLFRPKVVFLFVRYLLVFSLFLLFLKKNLLLGWGLIIFFFIPYLLWTIIKNYRYVNKKEAIIFLPLLQFTADFAIILGTITGLFTQLQNAEGER